MLIFKQNESLKCKGCLQEISFWAKWNSFNSVYGQSLISAYLVPEINETHCTGYFDRNENSMFMKSSKTNLHMQIFQKVKDSTSKDQNKNSLISFHFSHNEN